jgi:hypothetical protein
MVAISEENRKTLDSGNIEVNPICYIKFIIFEFARGF